MSRGARVLLAFLESKINSNGITWWGQKRMAVATGYGLRSIKRFTAELVASGEMETVRRAGKTNIYRPVEKLSTVGPKWPTSGAKMAPSSIELNLEQEKSQSEGSMPKEFLTNEYGRREPNPEWIAVQAALRRARNYIVAARNPAAYEQKVVREALDGSRKPVRREVAI